MKTAKSPKELVSVENVSTNGCSVTLRVDISTELSLKSYNEAIKFINQEVSLPGFRKGKAPKDYIEKHFQKPLHAKWKEIVSEKAAQNAFEISNLYPYQANAPVSLSWIQDNPANPASFQILFESSPNVPEFDLKTLSSTQPTVKEISADSFEKEFAQEQRKFATWNEITTRPSQEGDRIEFNLKDLSDENSTFQERRVDLLKDALNEWLYQSLVGNEIGSSKTVNRPSKDHAHDKSFEIIITKILEPQLPEISDELAEKVGFKNLNDWKARIEENQKEIQMHEYISDAENSIHEMLSQVAFEVPNSLLEREVSMRVARLENPSEELKEKAKIEAAKALRVTYIIHHLVEKLNLPIDSKKLQARTEMYLYGLKIEKDQEKMRQMFLRARNAAIAEVSSEAVSMWAMKELGWFIPDAMKELLD